MITKQLSKQSPTLLYVFFLFGYFFQTSNIPAQYRFFRMIMLSLYFIGFIIGIQKLLFQRWTKRELLLSISLLGLGFGTFIANRNIDLTTSIGFFSIIFLIVCSKNLNLDKLIKIDLISRIMFTILLFFLTKMNLLINVTTVRDDGKIRESFGYGHPNRLGTAIFLIVLYSGYLRRKKLSVLDLLFQISMLVATSSITDSRSNQVGIILVILYTTWQLLKNRIFENKLRRVLSVEVTGLIFQVLAFILIVLIVYLCFNYDYSDPNYLKLNTFLNSRIELGKMIINYYHLSPFGRGIQTYTWEEVMRLGLSKALVSVDVLYVYVLVTFGIVAILLYIFILLKIIDISAKKDSYLLFSIMIIILVSCIENQYLAVGSNIFLLLFSNYIYKTSGKEKIIKELSVS